MKRAVSALHCKAAHNNIGAQLLPWLLINNRALHVLAVQSSSLKFISAPIFLHFLLTQVYMGPRKVVFDVSISGSKV